jgi:hypothetical protein
MSRDPARKTNSRRIYWIDPRQQIEGEPKDNTEPICTEMNFKSKQHSTP